MLIRPCGSVPTRQGSTEYFIGQVWLDPIVEAPAPARIQSVMVSFAPGARTAWHTHPLGQTLYVTAGSGLAQTYGQPIQKIQAGDTVWIPPGEEHWHGAGPKTGLTHLAMQEAMDGTTVEWLEHVTDAEYHAAEIAD